MERHEHEGVRWMHALYMEMFHFVFRLPIVQGPTFTFVAPAIAIFALDKWKCPSVAGKLIFGLE